MPYAFAEQNIYGACAANHSWPGAAGGGSRMFARQSMGKVPGKEQYGMGHKLLRDASAVTQSHGS